MEKRILVPLDGSALAEMSVPHAVSLAHATSGTLTLLWVVAPAPVTLGVPMDGSFPASPALMEAREREPRVAREYLNRFVERLHVAEGLNVETIVQEGDPASMIVQYAEQNPSVKLIAMATHGRKGVSCWVFGSVAEKVLHASPVPLLLVRQELHASIEASTSHYTRILVPLDGSTFAENALEHATALAATLRATLILFTVLPNQYDRVMTNKGGVGEWEWVAAPWAREAEWATSYLEDVAQNIAGAGILVETKISFGDPVEEILRMETEAAADMIVMSTHGRSGVQRLWLGSVAMKVVGSTTRPVLLVRAKERTEVPELQPSAASRSLQVC
ncbi:MAG: universal stress protein [Chloroflexia bacterium]